MASVNPHVSSSNSADNEQRLVLTVARPEESNAMLCCVDATATLIKQMAVERRVSGESTSERAGQARRSMRSGLAQCRNLKCISGLTRVFCCSSRSLEIRGRPMSRHNPPFWGLARAVLSGTLGTCHGFSPRPVRQRFRTGNPWQGQGHAFVSTDRHIRLID